MVVLILSQNILYLTCGSTSRVFRTSLTTTTCVPLQFRDIQAIQYYVNCTEQRRTSYMDATIAFLVKFYPI